MQTYYQCYWNKTSEENIRILRMFGESEEAVVPEMIAGRAVVEAGDYCFAVSEHLPSEYECTVCIYDTEEKKWQEIPADGADWNTRLVELSGDRLKKVTLPDNMHKVGNYAFYNCTALEMLVTGKYLEEIGSDAFMNCKKFHFLTVRCDVGERSGANQILSRISADMEVTFQGKTGQTAVFYPEYYESYDEIAPAHIFGRSIEGEGFRARQCFKEGVPDLSQYDTIFPKACAEEKENTLLHILSLRLRYPVSLTDEAKERYVAHLREQELYIIPKLVGQKNMERITLFCENGWITQAAVKAGLEQASRMEWAEGTAELLHLQRKYFTEQKKERYSFDELW